MSSASVRISGDGPGTVIAVTPHQKDDALKVAVYRHLISARWVKQRHRWEVPGTPGGFARVCEFLNAVHPGLIDVDPAVAERARRLDRAADNVDHVSIPFPTRTRPWRHQVCAHHFLTETRANVGAALLDCGMRTGKTRMVLEHVRSLPRDLRRAVVFTPKSVVPVWREQADKHIDDRGELTVHAVDDGTVAQRVRRVADLVSGGDPVLIAVGWAVLERLTPEEKKHLRMALGGATVVADEVHFAKGPGSSRSENLAYISRRAAMRIGASGTPLSQSPLDAYAVWRFLDPGVWGTNYSRFRERYAEMGGFGNHKVYAYRNLEELAGWMSPYTFRATRDVLELPDAEHIETRVAMPGRAVRMYEELEAEGVVELDTGELRAANALAVMTRLAQLANGYLPAADGSDRVSEIHHAKREALSELLEQCDATEPWVVFCRFHHDLDEIHRAAVDSGRDVFELSGRRKELDAWRGACRAGRGPVLAAQIQAGGIGIDLTEAAFCAYFSKGFSRAEYVQSLARVHGPDQTRPVTYYQINSRGTIDVYIARALEKSGDLIEEVSLLMLMAHGRR